MVRFLSLVLAAVLACALAALFFFKTDVALVATVGIGAVSLAWLVAVVVLPWNLHFRARHVLAEMKVSEQRGIRFEGHCKELQELQQGQRQLAEAARAGDQQLDRKLDSVARKFEETIDRLTDNQEIITGIKAFLRLVQPGR